MSVVIARDTGAVTARTVFCGPAQDSTYELVARQKRHVCRRTNGNAKNKFTSSVRAGLHRCSCGNFANALQVSCVIIVNETR
jgi:hypothetical protein